MELAWYDHFIVRFLLMLLRPVVRLTIAWCRATSFRRSIVRLAWGPVKDGEVIHLVRLRRPLRCADGFL